MLKFAMHVENYVESMLKKHVENFRILFIVTTITEYKS